MRSHKWPRWWDVTFSCGERNHSKSGKYACAAISNILLLNVCVYYFEDDAWSNLGGDVVGVMDHNRSMDQNWDKDTVVLGHVCSKVNKYF